MILLEILFLAVVQGITEFLPISSSGHLVVLAALFDQFGHPMEEKLTVNIVLHLGTLAAILVFFWRRIVALLGEDRRVVGLIVVGSLPAAVVGLVLKKYFDHMLVDPMTAGLMFPVTGIMLLWIARRTPGKIACRELSFGHALLVGLFQAAAILPGISRSGATIVAGLGVGLKREEAAAFSFLLAIPVMAGAGLLEVKDMLEQTVNSTPVGPLVLGALVSFAVGMVSLWWLVRWVQRGQLHWFAYWVLPLGPLVILWQLFFR
jgi:undecaprenyl-diphosphatase